MSHSSSDDLKKTSLNATHKRMGGKMVPFAGWEMPAQFSGVIDEHLTVRTKVGLFDVSHMGELIVSGPDCLDFLQWITCNNVARLKVGQIQYSALMYPEGTFVDDLLVNRLGETEYLLCINAANEAKDFEYIQSLVRGNVTVENRSGDYAQLAIQGPNALSLLNPLVEHDLEELKYYWLVHTRVCGHQAIVSRTGYTGEDGFEVYLRPDLAEGICNALFERDAEEGYGLKPIGLGARDTLRLEAKMALYGNDIDNTTTVLEADLGWIVKLKKGEFIGRDVLARQKEEGLRKILTGFEMIDKGIARKEYPLLHQEKECGRVTSGSYAPYLKRNIGLGYMPVEKSEIGTEIAVLIRGREASARIVETPFYSRKRD